MNLESLSEALRSLGQSWSGSELPPRLLETAVTLLLLWIVQRFLSGYFKSTIDDVERQYQYRSWTRMLLTFVGFILLIPIWLPSGQLVLQVLALLAAGLALTLSRPISAVMAWIVILVRAPIRVGDRIEAAGVAGDVVDLGVMHIHLLEIGNWVDADQSTGRIVHLPNTVIFDGPVYNYTETFKLLWNELTIVLTHDSDWETARRLLLEEAEPFYEQVEEAAQAGAKEMAQRYAYHQGVTTPFVYVQLLRDGIELTLRYLVHPRRRRGTGHDITTGFLEKLKSYPAIRLAPPAYRVMMQHEDGRLLQGPAER